MASLITRSLLAGTSFAVGFAAFARTWPEHPNPAKDKRTLQEQRTEIIDKLETLESYQTVAQDPRFVSRTHASTIPRAHQPHMVSHGLLFGPDHLEIDPILFINKQDHELQAYYHLGKNLTSYDGTIHNGVISTILDESTTLCGFPLLPSGRGVTAKLSINFLEHAEPDSTVVLKAKVREHKGRKVVIDGYLETLGKNPIKLAQAECILVEPKWFKYLKWLQLF